MQLVRELHCLASHRSTCAVRWTDAASSAAGCFSRLSGVVRRRCGLRIIFFGSSSDDWWSSRAQKGPRTGPNSRRSGSQASCWKMHWMYQQSCAYQVQKVWRELLSRLREHGWLLLCLRRGLYRWPERLHLGCMEQNYGTWIANILEIANGITSDWDEIQVRRRRHGS